METWECPFCFCEDAHAERCELRHRKTPPAAPTIHMNGTGYRDLYEYGDKAIDAVNAAITALSAAAPNGRDYYVQTEPGAVNRAQDEHWDRLARLRAIKAELEFIQMQISDQEPKRGNR